MSTPTRWSVFEEEEEVKQVFAQKYLIVPIVQPKILGKVGIGTHISNLLPQSPLPSRGPHGGENSIRKRADVVWMNTKV